MTKPWIEFVQRIDSLFQESILVCVQSSLDKFLHLLTGSGSFRADPIINFGVTIDGPQICFDPPLSHIEQFLQSLLLHLSDMFMINYSLWKKFETEKSMFVRDGLKANAINKRILEGKKGLKQFCFKQDKLIYFLSIKLSSILETSWKSI